MHGPFSYGRRVLVRFTHLKCISVRAVRFFPLLLIFSSSCSHERDVVSNPKVKRWLSLCRLRTQDHLCQEGFHSPGKCLLACLLAGGVEISTGWVCLPAPGSTGFADKHARASPSLRGSVGTEQNDRTSNLDDQTPLALLTLSLLELSFWGIARLEAGR